MRLRIAILTPFALPSVRGNAVTVERLRHGLGERGVDARVWDASVVPEAAIEAEVAAYRPDLVQAFHAWRVGPLALRLAQAAAVPLVVTLTGTDVNEDLDDPRRGAAVRRVLEGASAVVGFHGSVVDRVAQALPAAAPRLHVVPQSVRMDGREPFDLAASWPELPPDRVLFVFPGGVRPVKQPRAPLGPLGRLHARDRRVHLLYVGPVLDSGEGAALDRAIRGLPWVRRIGPVSHPQMPALLAQVDVVLNCSRSEGGMANSVLEALAAARAVLAADIVGNRSLVEDRVTGLLYRDEIELEARAEDLARDPDLRRRLGAAGRELVCRQYPPSRELDGYLALFCRLGPAASS